MESVLQQDYPHIECIVVDGGSTDNTIEILERYEGRIQWISEPDNGHADAINKGWRMSKGEILAWLNADDVWVVPDAVSQAVAYLQENPEVDVVYGDCGAIDAEGNLTGMSYLHEWDLEYAVEHCDHCIPQPAAFIQRQILDRAGWLDVDFISKKDHEFWLRVGLVGNIRHVPVLLAHARDCPRYMDERGDITAGQLSDEDLILAYNGCQALVYPSRTEGFGLPLLEALACGTPVVSSNAGALREVAGQHCGYFDPDSPDEFVFALSTALDQGRANQFVQARISHAKSFSWNRAADETLAVYRSVAN